jgi:hypothetical protein
LNILFEKSFKTRRPKWLNHLELDCYNEELNLAVEYNGEQHYKYIPFYHKNNINEYKEQIKKDKLKIKLYQEYNVNLIIIPYTVHNSDIHLYLTEKLIDLEFQSFFCSEYWKKEMKTT